LKYNQLTCLLIAIVLLNCSHFAADTNEDAVARVNDNYLFNNAIKNLVPEGSSVADSTFIVNGYIDNWARGLLLMDKARLNLSDEKQKNFQNLVDQYKNDLFTKAYLDALVKRGIDTVIIADDARKVYDANKESFKLNDELLQLRYISLPQNAINIEKIKARFKRYNFEDKRYLDSIAVQFKSYSLNDSVWVKSSQVINKIPVVNEENRNQLLKKSNFIQLKDSLNLYLMQINNVLLRNDYAPLDYVKLTVNQIILNKRKLELIRQIEKDIITDAIKNKQFETFN
jgi:hypothetical protein